MLGTEAKTLLREMIRIRVAEETVARHYPEQEMRTPTHFSIGQEAISVGACQALERTDAAYSGHRCHGEYLAKAAACSACSPSCTGASMAAARGAAARST